MVFNLLLDEAKNFIPFYFIWYKNIVMEDDITQNQIKY